MNKKNIAIIISVIATIIIIILIILISNLVNRNDLSNAIHAVTISENTVFYKRAKLNNVKIRRTLDAGEEVYILDEFEDKNGTSWNSVSVNGKKGYILSSALGTYKKSENDMKLMVDVSQFNEAYNFETAGKLGVFLIKNDIDYVYIRLGGRGYGEDGNLYLDECYKMWADECEYLGLPFGFYFLDEALDNEEIDEEIEYILDVLDGNDYKYNVLPLAIDVESHDGKGRADSIWKTRSHLVSRLLKKLEREEIDTIVYSNALTASTYLSSLNTSFWVAYYPTLNGSLPDYWYDETDQKPTKNEEFMDKLIAWQFTDTGVDGLIDENVDLSLVLDSAFD